MRIITHFFDRANARLPCRVIIAASFVTSVIAQSAFADGVDFFEKKIRPVLVEHCYECHSSTSAKFEGELRLDSRSAIRKGGESGPAIVPGRIDESLLIDAIQHASLEMPPDKRLPDAVIADFIRWVEMGAPDPRVDDVPDTNKEDSWEQVLRERKKWWSLQPVVVQPVPNIKRQTWATNPIDHFVLAKLEAEGLEPAPAADARTLARRLSFVLTGLPPNADYAKSLGDRPYSQAEFQREVERLLGSPHFGERWARHWMDVVGFTETHGHEWNFEIRDAWRYRDYLIRALNNDVPFDRLIREHIAGDLMPEARWNEQEGINESPIGTAFLRFGEMDHDDCRLFPAISLDAIDHQIDSLTKAFQATTVACARCHDHKLDAISMNDYYALGGVLASSRNVIHTIDLPNRNRASKDRLRRLKSAIQTELTRLWQVQLADAKSYLMASQLQIAAAAQVSVTEYGDLDQGILNNWTKMLKAAVERSQVNEDRRLPIDDFEFLWMEFNMSPAHADSFPQHWSELRAECESERRDRTAFNAENFQTLADFRSTIDDAWYRNGLALEDGISPSGDFSISTDGDSIVRAVLPAGLHSHSLSTRLNASLSSPHLPKSSRYVSLELLGGSGGVWRNVKNNCAIENAVSKQLNSNVFRWHRVSTRANEPDVRSVIEVATKFDDQGFPYLSHNKIVDATDTRSYVGIGRVLVHDCEDTPQHELNHLAQMFAAPSPRSVEDLAERYARALRAAVSAWGNQTADDGDVHLINWMLEHELLRNSPAATPSLRQLIEEYRDVEGQLEPARSVAGVAEFAAGFDMARRIRGDVLRPAELVQRRYVDVLTCAGVDTPTKGSGRLQLANHIASEQNPLTARVYVNRIWLHVFGQGLVRTPDDFGRLGELPTHPDLLDYLAGHFVQHGWSTKELIRLLVTSRAFQMSSTASPASIQHDPSNRWWHHYPLQRLEGEAIRDSILAASGDFDSQLYGRSIHPYRFDERPMRRLFCGPLDGNSRRSIYQKITLTEEPPFLSVFNLPDPKATKGRRDVTNVPAQALTLLNDPFVIQQAELWAARLLSAMPCSLDERLVDMSCTAFGRPPTSAELERYRAATRQLAALHSVSEEDLLINPLVWKEVAHSFFNMKEFIFVR